MSEYPDCGERRKKLSSDWIERDRLLSEVHSDVKHMVEWAKAHDADDNARFRLVNNEIEQGKKVLYGAVGVLLAAEFLLKVLK